MSRSNLLPYRTGSARLPFALVDVLGPYTVPVTCGLAGPSSCPARLKLNAKKLVPRLCCRLCKLGAVRNLRDWSCHRGTFAEAHQSTVYTSRPAEDPFQGVLKVEVIADTLQVRALNTSKPSSHQYCPSRRKRFEKLDLLRSTLRNRFEVWGHRSRLHCCISWPHGFSPKGEQGPEYTIARRHHV